jgi:hypothetical protein
MTVAVGTPRYGAIWAAIQSTNSKIVPRASNVSFRELTFA